MDAENPKDLELEKDSNNFLKKWSLLKASVANESTFDVLC
jgi:hypothetical protein